MQQCFLITLLMGGELLYLSAILTVWDNFNIMTVILWGTYVTHNNKII